MHPISQQWYENSHKLNHHLCLGLDPDLSKLPPFISKNCEGVKKFLIEVIEATKDLTVTYKANISFFEALGLSGLQLLLDIKKHIPKNVPLIIDAKRGDIGNTSKMQAKFIFEELKADATTLYPYMGNDSLEPFFQYSDKFNFVLCLTSNPGSVLFEKQKLNNQKYLYEYVLEEIANWNTLYKNVGAVIGATQVELEKIREINKEVLFLIPGVGTQGGSYEASVKHGKNHENNVLINISRSLLYCSAEKNYAEEIRKKILKKDF